MSDFWAQQRSAAKQEQVQAAERETGRVFSAVKDIFRAEEVVASYWGNHTERWRQTIADNLEHRRMKMCQHLRNAPMQPTMIAAHKLDRALCEPCSLLVLSAEYSAVEDNTCDVCHVHHPEGIYPVAHQTGTLIVTGGLCEQCRAEDKA
jgi:hypothetical protein